MHFKTTLLVALSALAAAQQSSQAVDNPATGYLEQTNAAGAVTGQSEPATSQQAAVTSLPAVVTSQDTPANVTSPALIPSQTSEGSTLATSAMSSSSDDASSTATLTSTATKSTSSSSSDDDDSNDSLSSSSSFSSSSSAASSSASEGAAAVPTAGSVGLTVGLAGAALAALL